MEPNKFEEHIRTQLQERELQPSKEAWAKLETQLGDTKGSNKTMWFAIAASLVAIIVVGSFLLTGTGEVSNEIVQEIPSIEKETAPVEVVANTEESTPVENNKTTPQENQMVPKQDSPRQQLAATNDSGSKASESKGILPEKVQLKEEGIARIEPQEPLLKEIETKDIVNRKVDEVVAEVQRLTEENATVTPQEIEALLTQAQRDISNQRLLKEATTSIDPASLLKDVESEMERSFRDKVFDALGEGFNVVRTAVVQRNN